ncbi:hypothetical protein [Spirosoma pomorum]
MSGADFNNNLAKWIDELNSIDLSVIDASLENKVNEEGLIRAIKYDTKTERGRYYDNFIFKLSENVITQFSTLNNNEVNTFIKRLLLIKERCKKAIVDTKKHRRDFDKNKFIFRNFENDLWLWVVFPYSVNNKPIEMSRNEYISKYLFTDLLEAFDSKLNTLDWVILTLEEIHFPDRNNGVASIVKNISRTISLLESDQKLLFDELSFCISENQHELFKQALEGKNIIEPITLDCTESQTKLSKAFAKVLVSSQIKPKACSE